MTITGLEVVPVDVDLAIRTAVNSVSRFRRYAHPEDVRSEILVYLYGTGKKHVEKWSADGEEFRITRAFCGVARQYAEREKAAALGYSFDDLAWYSPEKLADLVPLALNMDWEGISGDGEDPNGSFGTTDGAEGGTLLAMVADIRRALGNGVDYYTVEDFDPLKEEGMERLVKLADRLGGEFPDAPGYGRGRKAISNSRAQQLVREGYGL